MTVCCSASESVERPGGFSPLRFVSCELIGPSHELFGTQQRFVATDARLALRSIQKDRLPGLQPDIADVFCCRKILRLAVRQRTGCRAIFQAATLRTGSADLLPCGLQHQQLTFRVLHSFIDKVMHEPPPTVNNSVQRPIPICGLIVRRTSQSLSWAEQRQREE